MKFVVGLLCSSFFFVTMALSAHAAPPTEAAPHNATSIIVCNTKATLVIPISTEGAQQFPLGPLALRYWAHSK